MPDSLRESQTLFAVCDVLAMKALESIGKRIVRISRSRFDIFNASGLPVTRAHTMWQVPDEIVTKGLKGAWDVVPTLNYYHSCCGVSSEELVKLLDSYIHDLVITGTPHSVDGLRYRFKRDLCLDVPDYSAPIPSSLLLGTP